MKLPLLSRMVYFGFVIGIIFGFFLCLLLVAAGVL